MKNLSKYIFITFLSLLFLVVSLSSPAQSVWESEYYNRYNHHNFTTFAHFDSVIHPNQFDHALLNAAVFFETNRQRVLYGLAPLKHHSSVEQCAQGHSNDMANFHFFSHTSTVPGKYTLSQRAEKVGFRDAYIGENIFIYSVLDFTGKSYYTTSQKGKFIGADGKEIKSHTYLSLAKELVSGWMNSPGHRANILNRNYTHAGMGNALYYKGFGLDKVPNVKSTQNFIKVETLRIVSPNRATTHTTRSHSQNSYTTSIGLSAAYSAPYQGISNMYLFFSTGKEIYKTSTQSNFWGCFASIELSTSPAISLEAGTLYNNLWRISAGALYLPGSQSMQSRSVLCPSVTGGLVLINYKPFFASANINALYFENNLYNQILATVGIYF